MTLCRGDVPIAMARSSMILGRSWIVDKFSDCQGAEVPIAMLADSSSIALVTYVLIAGVSSFASKAESSKIAKGVS